MGILGGFICNNCQPASETSGGDGGNKGKAGNNETSYSKFLLVVGLFLGGAAALFGLYVAFIGIDKLTDRSLFFIAIGAVKGMVLSVISAFSLGQLAALNRRTENVIVEAIIVPELELRNVKWHVTGTYLVERADDAALEDAPKTLNRLGMDGADNILMLGMVAIARSASDEAIQTCFVAFGLLRGA